MISFASETINNSSTVVGNSENATAALPSSTKRSSSFVPRRPPMKSTRLSVRTSLIPKNRIEQSVLKNTHVERCDSARRQCCCGRELQAIPLAIEIHAPVTALRRLRTRVLSDRELLL